MTLIKSNCYACDICELRSWLLRTHFRGIVFGHLGDKLGPKTILLLTVVLMGIATFCMELLPTYAALGVGASITSANGVHTVQITEYVLVMLLAHAHHLPLAIVCRNGQSGPVVSTSLGY